MPNLHVVETVIASSPVVMHLNHFTFWFTQLNEPEARGYPMQGTHQSFYEPSYTAAPLRVLVSPAFGGTAHVDRPSHSTV
jgi:hypothetical protein